jgi:hypothetical protein
MKGWMLVLLLGVCAVLCGQETTASQSPTSKTSPVAAMPVEYQATEFPAWAIELRRAEIITVGAFPFVFLFSGLAFDIVYWTTHGFLIANAPWPVGQGTSAWSVTSNPIELASKNLLLVSSTLAVSVLIAAADFALGFWHPQENP